MSKMSFSPQGKLGRGGQDTGVLVIVHYGKMHLWWQLACFVHILALYYVTREQTETQM